MPGEYFNEIQNARQEIARKEALAREEAARKQREYEAENKRKQEAREKEENLKKQKLETERRVVNLAISKMQDIFQDIVANSPDIQKASRKRIQVSGDDQKNRRTISLQWGEKFELTPEEKRFIESNEYVSLMGLFRYIPEFITGINYFSISVDVDSQRLSVNDHKGIETQKFNADYKIGIPTIAESLASPRHETSILRKGSDYWKEKRPSRSSGSSSSSSIGSGECCCD